MGTCPLRCYFSGTFMCLFYFALFCHLHPYAFQSFCQPESLSAGFGKIFDMLFLNCDLKFMLGKNAANFMIESFSFSSFFG